MRSHRFRVGDFDVTPSAVDKVPLRKDADLRIVIGESYEAETFALASFCILLDLSTCKHWVREWTLFFVYMSDENCLDLYLCHQKFTKVFKIHPQVLLGCFPWQSKHNEVRALEPHFHPFGFGCGVFWMVI